MDRLIDKFYNGSMSTFGFGTLGNGRTPNITTNKISTPKPNSQNSIYNNYNNKNTIYSVPKTQYSMGLNAPVVSNPLITQSITLPYRPNYSNYNDTQMQTQTTKKYFKPEILKVQMLEQKIKEMEEKNKEDKKRMREIIEGNVLNAKEPPKNNNTDINNNIDNANPNSLEQALNNIQLQSEGMLSEKQALRRQQIQYELNQARKKLINDRTDYGNNQNYDDDEDEEDEEEEDEEDENNNKIFGNLAKRNQKNRKTALMNNTNTNINDNDNGGEISIFTQPTKKENDYNNNIPDHLAIQLQADNFKVRANLAQVKDGFRNIRNQLEDKLESLQINQRLNYEKIRYIIEQGGNNKMKAGVKKLIDGEDIDINNVQDEIPDYIKNLPNLIEEKLKKAENIRKTQENQELFEEQQMIDAEIGQKFNISSHGTEINSIDLQNEKISNPWEVISSENKYEYIPGKGATISKKIIPNINKTSTNVTKNQKLFTEEEENNLVNKIADKIINSLNKGTGFKKLLNNNIISMTNSKNSKFTKKKISSKEKKIDEEILFTDADEISKSKKKSKNKKSSKKSKKSSKKSKKTSKKSSDDNTKKSDDEIEEKEKEDEKESVDISGIPSMVNDKQSNSISNTISDIESISQNISKSKKKSIPLQSKSQSKK